jgi:hypothetical protein
MFQSSGTLLCTASVNRNKHGSAWLFTNVAFVFHIVIFSMTTYTWLFFIVLINCLTTSRYAWRLVRYSGLVSIPPNGFWLDSVFLRVSVVMLINSVTSEQKSGSAAVSSAPDTRRSVLCFKTPRFHPLCLLMKVVLGWG